MAFETQVAAGVDALNERGPAEWWTLLDLDELDLTSVSQCVLGQLYGHYGEGAAVLFPDEAMLYDPRQAADHGFTIRMRDDCQDWDALTAQWKQQIRSLVYELSL